MAEVPIADQLRWLRQVLAYRGVVVRRSMYVRNRKCSPAAMAPVLAVGEDDAETVVVVNLEAAPPVEVRESGDRSTSCCTAV